MTNSSQPVNGYQEKGPYRLVHDVYVLLDYGDRLILDQFDLTTTQFRLLNLLDGQPGLRLTTLSDRLLRSKSQVTRVVDALEARGLLIRIVDGTDRRAQRVRITQVGQALREKVNRQHQESLEARLSSLNLKEQHLLTQALEKLKRGMSQYLELE